jgi:hypothetical protein
MCWKAGSFWLGFTATAVAKLCQKRKVPANFTFNETLVQTVTSVSTKHCISGQEVCTVCITTNFETVGSGIGR